MAPHTPASPAPCRSTTVWVSADLLTAPSLPPLILTPASRVWGMYALVYTYQMFVTGSLGVSAELVGVSNPGNTIGTFDIGDINASAASFTPNARWLFSPEIPTGMSSWGLAFSSLYLPIVGAALTIDGGTQALVAGVPTPGPVALPEPASGLLLALPLLVARRRCSVRPV